ncbi:MAG: four helix bundle protein [Bacteroidaceae bacterium]|jgi:four helix bundle protein|uniref:four helix bundle protein n=1 Tax=unclassified Bacteroides TaxID=2646097 RepID=UPI0004E27B24|nr:MULTISPECIES: four helix bundle protein [unclassified Bacteroides]MBP3243555.1 four helix bundle protein [Bacteroidaceae bacterium]MBQ2572662.1 four helix bundle protein [Bacteroidales bacterium]SDF69981.1 four helix bundle protein [Bacteroidales bacterium KHT7]MBQ1677182.1 four helix bundle protein [Bacteroidaceae bacterium]MBQ5351403.1 four helix bundle protein [Bacteroidaceae bacterium]
MKTANVVKDKSLAFGVRIVRMVRHLLKDSTYAEHPIFAQILKSGTSIGANIREAEHAESIDDFKHKLKIALKEANETLYWLEILFRSNYVSEKEYESMICDCTEINKILVSIINTLNKKSK